MPGTLFPPDRTVRLLRQEMSNEEAAAVADDIEALLMSLQTCLHLLARDGYLGDSGWPEADEALAVYERITEARR